MGDTVIVKVQKPLATNTTPMALVYNKNRSVLGLVPWTKELEKQFGKDDKQYWVATEHNGTIELVELTKEQEW